MDIAKNDLLILKEVGNIGAGQSSILLAKKLNKTINIRPESISVIEGTELKKVIDPTPGVFGIYIALYKDLVGDSMILFKDNSLTKIIDIAKGKREGTTRHIKSSVNKQLIREIGNITLIPYIRSLCEMLDLDIKYTVPIPIHERSSDMLSFLDGNSDDLLLIKTDLEISNTTIKDQMFIIIRPKNIKKVLDILKKKVGY